MKTSNFSESTANQSRSNALKVYWKTAEERRQHLRDHMKGKDNPAKREDIRRKISEGKRGKKVKHARPLSGKQLDHLRRLAKERKDGCHSIDTRLKISSSRKGKCIGRDNPMFGKKHTEETKAIIKRAHEVRHDEHLRSIYEKAKALVSIGIEIDSACDPGREVFPEEGSKLDSLGYIIGTIPTDAYFGVPPSAGTYVYHIAAKDKDFVNTVADCLRQMGIDVNLNRRKKGKLWCVQTSRRKIEQFLPFLKKENDSQWVFAEKIFTFGSNFRRSILVAVSDAEGCVTNARSGGSTVSRQVTITNSSKVLLGQIKSLLEGFGVKSYIYLHREPRKAEINGEIFQFKKQVFTLVVTGHKNLLNFRNAVGFSIARKQDRLVWILESYTKIGRQYSIKDYELVLQLSNHFSSYADISNIAHIPVATIRNWMLHDVRPRSTKGRVLS